LWFDHQAEEATNFYVSIFKNSRVGSSARYGEEGAKTTGRPTCSVMTVAFELDGQDFTGERPEHGFILGPTYSADKGPVNNGKRF
jgi:predicted 3-demethylubiquinone-9 3-methyltransferase (glyoxalase superfamily)